MFLMDWFTGNVQVSSDDGNTVSELTFVVPGDLMDVTIY